VTVVEWKPSFAKEYCWYAVSLNLFTITNQ
jgi:hypothetical protein